MLGLPVEDIVLIFRYQQHRGDSEVVHRFNNLLDWLKELRKVIESQLWFYHCKRTQTKFDQGKRCIGQFSGVNQCELYSDTYFSRIQCVGQRTINQETH